MGYTNSSLVAYTLLKDVFSEYKKSGYSKAFYEVNKEAIENHRAAKRAFNQKNLKKLPTIKELNKQYQELLSQKNEIRKEYRENKQHLREMQIAMKNVQVLYDDDKRKEQDLEK